MGLFASLTALDNWFLESIDVPTEKLQGQFPIEPTENVTTNYAQHNALNRANPIVQFLNGTARTVSFEAKFYARDAVFSGVQEAIDQLKTWATRDERLGRPHLLKFYVGDGHLGIESCVITSLGGIKYGQPTITGAVRDVTLSVELLSYEKYSLEKVAAADTLYYRTKERDYYEMLSYQEYGTPNFGDVIRKSHPTKPNVQVSDIVKLPSRETVSKEVVEPKSLQLETAYGRKETNQRTLRLAVFDRTNRTYVSHIIKE